LLECEAQKFAQSFLTHADQHAPDAHAIADLAVNGICFFGHGVGDDLGKLSGPVIELKEFNSPIRDPAFFVW
jgi:hypothetical protein